MGGQLGRPTVIRINPVTGTPGPPISVEGGADGVAAGDGSVWVIGQSDGVLSRIDPVARVVAGTTSVERAAAVAVGSDAVWVANGADGTVSKIDPSSGRLEGAFPVGKQPSGVAVAADGHVWVANAGSATLTELDPAKGHEVRAVPTGAPPSGVALDGETVYDRCQVPPSAHRGGTLTLAIANPPGDYAQPIPKALDPASGYSAWEQLTLTNDGLLGYSQAGGAATYKVVPDLATGLPTVSDGGLTYTFQLRKGIRYSTGGVVQPADIRRGIERALLQSGDQFPKMTPYLAAIEGSRGCLTGKRKHCDLTRGITTSPGSSTVTFHLSKPDPDFLFKLALPIRRRSGLTPLHARLPLPATGPYKIAGWRRRRRRARPQPALPRLVGRGAAGRLPRQDRRAVPLHRPVRDPCGRARHRRHHGGRLRSDLAARARGLPADAPLEPALCRATAHDPRALAEHEARAVQRRPRPAGAQPRGRPQPARPDQRRRGGVPVPAAERERLQLLLSYNGPDLTKARRLVAESGTKGQPITIWIYDIPAGHRNAAYLVPVLESIGYKARVEYVPHDGRASPGAPTARRASKAGAATTPPPQRLPPVPLQLLYDQPERRTNFAGSGPASGRAGRSCAVARATNPAAGGRRLARADRMLTDEAPWLPMKVCVSTDFVARRVGNYSYCWLSGGSGMTGACLDQLWVR